MKSKVQNMTQKTFENRLASGQLCQPYKKSLSRAHTYATRNYTTEGEAAAHFIVNMGAGNELFIVGMWVRGDSVNTYRYVTLIIISVTYRYSNTNRTVVLQY